MTARKWQNCCNIHPQLQRRRILLYYSENVKSQRVEIAIDKKHQFTARNLQTVVSSVNNYNIMEQTFATSKLVKLQK
jgi:hypothetical protein